MKYYILARRMGEITNPLIQSLTIFLRSRTTDPTHPGHPPVPKQQAPGERDPPAWLTSLGWWIHRFGKVIRFPGFVCWWFCLLKSKAGWFESTVVINNRYMGVSKNNGTPKSSILIGLSIINHPFWGTPIFGNTHIDLPIQSQVSPRYIFHHLPSIPG